MQIKGDLLFSLPNATDISSNSGQSLNNIESFLEDVGKNWIPLEYRPHIVMENENNFDGHSNVFLAVKFLENYLPFVYDDHQITLKKIVELSATEPNRSTIISARNRTNQKIATILIDFRNQWKSSDAIRKTAYSIPPFDPFKPKKFVYNSMMQLIGMKHLR